MDGALMDGALLKGYRSQSSRMRGERYDRPVANGRDRENSIATS